ncbi:hypothetical protein [Halorhodospira halochloris]|uniref:hypothetical protein n=1 Tax=Halorhodospira halochloris TaxID=1052 RepID=UPI001EE928C2|nr:hypothetical protein [Halorhodospira halochloris]MCG5547528.1 hypothetical protein [Halorhodospira halochloris]
MNGQEALDIWQQSEQEFDLILLDLTLRDINVVAAALLQMSLRCTLHCTLHEPPSRRSLHINDLVNLPS